MEWVPVNAFLDTLKPVQTQDFDEWWEDVWIPHQKKCLGAAKNIYIMEKCIATAVDVDDLRIKLEETAGHLGLCTETFMGTAWPRALKIFNQ